MSCLSCLSKVFSCRSSSLSSTSFSSQQTNSSYDLKETLCRLNEKDTSLNEIDLYDKKVDDDDIEKLVDAMLCFNSNKVTYLDLNKNFISDEGAKKLATLLRNNNSLLEELCINNNNIGTKGAVEIANALKSGNTKLEDLYLNNNPNIGNKGANEIAKSLMYNTTLRRLFLMGTSIGNDGSTGMINKDRNKNDKDNNNTTTTGDVILQTLRYNSILSNINIWKNNISNEEYTEIMKITNENKNKKRIDTVTRNKEKYVYKNVLNKHCSIFANELPNELKNEIYEYCFGTTTE